MKMYLISDNVDTQTGMRLAGIEGVVVHEREELRQMLRQSVMASAYCIFPCMIGVASCARPLVRVLFTDRWIAVVPYLRL